MFLASWLPKFFITTAPPPTNTIGVVFKLYPNSRIELYTLSTKSSISALIMAKYSSSISDLPYRMMFCISDSSTSPLSCLTHCSLIERIQVIRPFGIVTHFDSSGDLLITGIMSIVQLPISTISVFFAIAGILSTTAA